MCTNYLKLLNKCNDSYKCIFQKSCKIFVTDMGEWTLCISDLNTFCHPKRQYVQVCPMHNGWNKFKNNKCHHYFTIIQLHMSENIPIYYCNK